MPRAPPQMSHKTSCWLGPRPLRRAPVHTGRSTGLRSSPLSSWLAALSCGRRVSPALQHSGPGLCSVSARTHFHLLCLLSHELGPII